MSMVEIINDEVVARYEEAFEIYKDAHRHPELLLIETMLYSKDYYAAATALRAFKTEDELMETLENKLRDKPINNTLKKIRRGTVESEAQILKGLFSLGTHAMIEVERGNMEYMFIAKKIHEKLGAMLNG